MTGTKSYATGTGRGLATLLLLIVVTASAIVALVPRVAWAASTTPMYCLYNQWSGEHLFTTDAIEYDELAGIGWTKEGISWQVLDTGEPVYRLYNRYSGDHFYTKDAAEYERLGAIGWNQEGLAFRSGGETPIYRLFNRWLTAGTHLFTTDRAEYDDLVGRGWSGEGVAFYGQVYSNDVESKSPVERYTWGELASISEEIASARSDSQGLAIAQHYQLVDSEGKLDGTQTKSFTLADGTECSAQILGFRHDNLSDGSGKAGISWLLTDITARHQWNSTSTNAGGWEASSLRTYMNGEFYDLLPAELKSAIKPVDKLTNNVGVTRNVDSSASITKTSDRLWALGVTEAWGYADDYPIYNQEGEQYQLYADAGVTRGTDTGGNTGSILRKSGSGTSNWWLRTPSFDTSSDACISNGSRGLYRWFHGYSNNPCTVTNSNGVVPGFCI